MLEPKLQRTTFKMPRELDAFSITDSHNTFSTIVARHSWLAVLEQWCRDARIRSVSDLHQSFDFVHVICYVRLQFSDSVTADSHCCRLLDDAAEASL